MSQYDQCSANSACGCFPMVGAHNVGICGFLWTSCSTLAPCDSLTNSCAKDDQICVHHPRCNTRPICYPVSMIDPRICPTVPVGTSTTGMIPNSTEITSTTTTITTTTLTTTAAPRSKLDARVE